MDEPDKALGVGGKNDEPGKGLSILAVFLFLGAPYLVQAEPTTKQVQSNVTTFSSPPMGYSSWNHGGGSFPREANAFATADAVVQRGLKAAGYKYMMAFDGFWWTTEQGKRVIPMAK